MFPTGGLYPWVVEAFAAGNITVSSSHMIVLRKEPSISSSSSSSLVIGGGGGGGVTSNKSIREGNEDCEEGTDNKAEEKMSGRKRRKLKLEQKRLAAVGQEVASSLLDANQE